MPWRGIIEALDIDEHVGFRLLSCANLVSKRTLDGVAPEAALILARGFYMVQIAFNFKGNRERSRQERGRMARSGIFPSPVMGTLIRVRSILQYLYMVKFYDFVHQVTSDMARTSTPHSQETIGRNVRPIQRFPELDFLAKGLNLLRKGKWRQREVAARGRTSNESLLQLCPSRFHGSPGRQYLVIPLVAFRFATSARLAIRPKKTKKGTLSPNLY